MGEAPGKDKAAAPVLYGGQVHGAALEANVGSRLWISFGPLKIGSPGSLIFSQPVLEIQPS